MAQRVDSISRTRLGHLFFVGEGEHGSDRSNSTSSVWYNCLVTLQYDPEYIARAKAAPTAEDDWRIEVYMCNRKVVNGPTKQPEVVYPTGKRTMWAGDGYITDDNKQGDNNGKYPYWYPPPEDERRPEMLCVQQRELRQSRLFITYSLHRPTTNEQEGQLIMKKMADAAYELFGNDKWLAYNSWPHTAFPRGLCSGIGRGEGGGLLARSRSW